MKVNSSTEETGLTSFCAEVKKNIDYFNVLSGYIKRIRLMSIILSTCLIFKENKKIEKIL